MPATLENYKYFCIKKLKKHYYFCAPINKTAELRREKSMQSAKAQKSKNKHLLWVRLYRRYLSRNSRLGKNSKETVLSRLKPMWFLERSS